MIMIKMQYFNDHANMKIESGYKHKKLNLKHL
jgi:hypothetical protein